MFMMVFCEECRKEVMFKEEDTLIKSKINGVEYEYIGKKAICKECGSEVYIPHIEDENLVKFNELRRLKMKVYSYVNLAGVVLWSDAYKQKNNKYLHKYIVSIQDNKKKHNFHVISFDEKSSKPVYSKGDNIKVNGFLKVNSFKDKNGDWKNEVYIQVKEIESLDEE